MVRFFQATVALQRWRVWSAQSGAAHMCAVSPGLTCYSSYSTRRKLFQATQGGENYNIIIIIYFESEALQHDYTVEIQYNGTLVEHLYYIKHDEDWVFFFYTTLLFFLALPLLLFYYEQGDFKSIGEKSPSMTNAEKCTM